jgi:tetratricopeptide (TPR) repeat protein
MTILARPSEWTRTTSATASSTPVAGGSHHYFAFLSYSHRDQAIADWLHQALERFVVPSHLVGRITDHGAVPKRLTPIFRDLNELPASGDLGGEIRSAIAASRFLVVICSPAAARSRWTNAEIEAFKRARPEGCIFAVIIDGEPFASDLAGREEEECLPQALRYKYDRRGRPTSHKAEPLAADLRGTGEVRRLGFLKLVAGMLGLGLDELVQRDTIRRQRRLATVAGGSLVGMLIATGLAVTAIQARDAAQEQRRQAEGLVGFMLGDLKDKLEPIGRLDVLDSVGARALAYYEHQEKAGLSDASLAQRSKALTLMGQIASDRGNVDSALRLYKEAFESTAELLRREPDDPQRLFDHAQNVFYVGDVARQRGDTRTAEASLHEYKRLATKLIATDPSNPDWQMEGIYADTNLGILLLESGRYGDAATVFENSLADREKLAANAPEDVQFRKALISVLAWLGEAREKEGRLDDGLAQRERQISLLQPYINDTKSDAQYRRDALVAYRAAGRLNTVRGNPSRGLEQLRTSVRIGEELIEAEPQNADWAAMTAYAKFELARIELAQRNVEQAAALTRSGCDMGDRLVAKDSSVVDWRLDLRAWCLQLKARIAVAQGALVEAEGLADRLQQLARSEIAKTPSADAQLELANAELLRGLVAYASGSRAKAGAAFREAARSWPRQMPDRPPLLARKVLILTGIGRRDAANALALQLARMGYRDPTYMRDRALLGS